MSRKDEATVDKFHEHLSAAGAAVEFIGRFDDRNGWYSSKSQLRHAMLELQAALDSYDAIKAAHDRLYGDER